jgi:hypothetical protein
MWHGLIDTPQLGIKFAKTDSFGVRHKIASAPAANITFKWPVSLPGSLQVFTVNAAGDIGYQSLGGGGSVTSVALDLPASVFNISGSPVSSAGTLTGTFISQGAGLVFAAPAGAAGAPTFRGLAVSDIPTLTTAKISDFATAADARIDAKITGVIRYKGTYSGAAGTPPATPVQGDQYRITTAGSAAFGYQVNIGDYVLYNGTGWDKIDATDPAVTGTTNRVAVTPTGDTSYAVDIASNYVGQASITTVGTIATGTWQGTAIGIANGGTGATTAAAARAALGVAGLFKGTITSAGVTAGKFTIAHNLNNSAPQFDFYDNLGLKVVPDEVKAVDANTLEIDISVSFGTIAGTYNYSVVG